MLYLNALPFVLAIVLLATFSFEKLIYLIVFFSPLSIPLREYIPGTPVDMYLPTEPLLFGLLLLFIIKLVHERNFDKKILTHPISWAVYLNLFWILITCFTSTMPLVSFKFWVMRLWFVVGLYFLVAKLFREGKHMERYVWLAVVPLMLVVFYSTYRHLGYGLWDKQAAHFVVSPFYRDHTSYGAATAFFLPFMVMLTFRRDLTKRQRWMAGLALAVILLGFVLSYSRAAWLSIFVALMVLIVIKLKFRFQTMLLWLIGFLVVVFTFQEQILLKLEQNKQESSADLLSHFTSSTNIRSDASNLERINRWSCAIRMFRDKPVFGYGPGTYMFKYAPYQLRKDRTIISTNSADGGNAHSEYLGPLAESGLMGMLSYLILIATVLYTGINAYTRSNNYRYRSILLAAILGLITYYIHGFLNNFLDTDKISVPFWGFTAMIVAIDLLNKEERTNDKIPANFT